MHFTKTSERYLFLHSSTSRINEIIELYDEQGALTPVFMYSFSTDDTNWSEIEDKASFIQRLQDTISLDIAIFIRVYVNIVKHPDRTYDNTVYDCVDIKQFLINGNVSPITGAEYVKNVNIIRHNENSNVWNPYRSLENAHHIRTQIVDNVVSIFGRPATYFRTEADESSRSITFKSYQMHNTVEYKDLKFIMSEDEYESDPQTFVHFADYENLEIEISKSEWDATFPGTKPTSKDYIYIHVFKKPFRVVTVKEDRNFENDAVAYKFYLGKYFDMADVDDSLVQEQIDDFTEFIAHDDNDDEHLSNEVENATGIHDSYEETVIDDEMYEHNSTSTMFEAAVGMNNVPYELRHNGIKFIEYMYNNSIQEFTSKYRLPESLENEYSQSIWFRYEAAINSTIKIAEFSQDGIQYSELIYVNSRGKASVHSQNVAGQNYLTAQGDDLVPNTDYCITYVRNRGIMLIVVHALADGNLEVVQQNVAMNTSIPEMPKVYSVYGDANLFTGCIRVYNKALSADDMLLRIIKKHPDAFETPVIDNCLTGITGTKVT